MKKKLTFAIAFLTLTTTFATLPTTISRTLKWSETPLAHIENEVVQFQIQHFEGSSYSEMHPSLPYYSERFEINSPGNINIQLTW